MQGTEQERARWRVCINIVNDNLGMVVGRMYVQDHFEEKAKASVKHSSSHPSTLSYCIKLIITNTTVVVVVVVVVIVVIIIIIIP